MNRVRILIDGYASARKRFQRGKEKEPFPRKKATSV